MNKPIPVKLSEEELAAYDECLKERESQMRRYFEKSLFLPSDLDNKKRQQIEGARKVFEEFRLVRAHLAALQNPLRDKALVEAAYAAGGEATYVEGDDEDFAIIIRQKCDADDVEAIIKSVDEGGEVE